METATQIRIAEIKAIFATWDYNENGGPIGVDVEEWIALREELETLES